MQELQQGSGRRGLGKTSPLGTRSSTLPEPTIKSLKMQRQMAITGDIGKPQMACSSGVGGLPWPRHRFAPLLQPVTMPPLQDPGYLTEQVRGEWWDRLVRAEQDHLTSPRLPVCPLILQYETKVISG